MFGEMEIYGNGKIWKRRNGRKRKKGREREGDNDKYYLLRMILNKRFCFQIHFFIFDIQYIDKYSIERKCIPYIPQYGKARTVSKDNAIGIWRVRDTKPVEAHTSSYGRGLHGSMV